MGRLRMRGEELAVAAPARPSGRDDVMASPPPPRRQWLPGAVLELPFSSHVLPASTATYDESEYCPIRLRVWTDSPAIGGRPRGRTRLRCKVIAYMNDRVSFPLINSLISGVDTVHDRRFFIILYAYYLRHNPFPFVIPYSGIRDDAS
jgi:hypothetical protein